MGVAARGGGQPAPHRLARAGDDGHGNLAHQLGPAAPAVQVLQAVRAHDPDEADARVARLQRADGVDGIADPEPGLPIGDDHPGAPGQALG